MASEPDPPEAGLLVGLTGGIASGKSTVAEHFARLGIPIIDTDTLSRELVEPDDPEQLLARLRQRFGPAIITADGRLDRRRLRELVFRDEQARRALEALLHPAIRRRALAQARHAARQAPYVLVVIPLLAEDHVQPHYAWLDRTITVSASPEHQRARLLQRPGIDADLADQMIAAQTNDKARRHIADFVIDNTTGPDALAPQIDRIDAALRHSARR